MFPIKDNIPTDRFPVVTVLLLVANVVMYFVFQHGGIDLSGNGLNQSDLVHYGAIPYELTHPGDHCDLDAAAGVVACEGQIGVTGTAESQLPTVVTIFTAMFMHGGLLHLGGNMLFLWIFGNNVEDAMGPVKFIVFYLLGGVAAFALQFAIDPSSQIPTLGASGAIAAVLGAYILLFPRAKVVTVIFIVFFFTILELPALLVLGIGFLEQALMGYFDLAQPAGGGGGVAYFAHVGGFVFGLLAVRLFANVKRTRRPQERFARG